MSRCNERGVAYDRGTTWAVILRVVSTSCGSHGMPCEVAYIDCEPNVAERSSYGWLLYKASIPGELGQTIFFLIEPKLCQNQFSFSCVEISKGEHIFLVVSIDGLASVRARESGVHT